MTYCELCDLDEAFCVHGRAGEDAVLREQRTAEAVLLVSPRGMAHFDGCPHKGDDPDLSRWAEVSGPDAWGRLGNGEPIHATGGAQRDLVATSRCSDCVAHGGAWL